MGRKPKTPEPQSCTDELIDKILVDIRSGTGVLTAAVANGVPKEVHHRWMNAPNQSIHFRYRREIHKAMAIAKRSAEQRVYRDSPRDWLIKGGSTRHGFFADDGWAEPKTGIEISASGKKSKDGQRDNIKIIVEFDGQTPTQDG